MRRKNKELQTGLQNFTLISQLIWLNILHKHYAYILPVSRWEWLDPGWGSPMSINFRISICPRDSFPAQDQGLDQLSLG